MECKFEKLRCLGSDIKISKKTRQAYAVALFQKGMETLQLMLPDNVTVEDDCFYNLSCDYSPKWKSLTLVSLSKID